MTAADELTDRERQVVHAAVTGKTADFHGSALDHRADRTTRDAGREIRARVLIGLLTAQRYGDGQPLRAVKVCGATITGALDLEASELPCPVQLKYCWFDEPVNLDEASAPMLSFRGSHVPSLTALRLRVGGSLVLDEGFTSDGEVSLIGARIRDRLVLNNAHISARTWWSALSADGIAVEQDVHARGLTAENQVRFISASIGGQLDLSRAHLANPGKVALSAENLAVHLDMLCIDGFTATGAVRLRGARIGGRLAFDGSSFTNPGAAALDASQLTVEQDLYCRAGLSVSGTVHLNSAHIRGHVFFDGAHLSDPGGTALSADWIEVGQSLFCREGFHAEGKVSMPCARIGGQVLFLDARLTSPGEDALVADRIEVGQSFVCQEGFTADGTVSLGSAHIGMRLCLDGAHLSNPREDALDAEGAVALGVCCRKEFAADGRVNLRGATVDGLVDFSDASLNNDSGTALDLGGTNIRELNLCTAQAPSGPVNLANSRVGVFTDDQRTWPATLCLRGFVYETFGENTIGLHDRLRWLARHEGGYAPQVYDQLAACYRRAGHEQDARRVNIAKQWRRRNARSPLNWLLYATVGYGYRTWLAVLWLAVLTALGALVFSLAHAQHLMHPGTNAPAFQPAIYALDTLVPVISFGQKTAWTATGWAQYWSWGLTAAGWILTTAAVAGLTGVFKRD